MYKVFVNESPLILTNELPGDANGNLFSMENDSVIEAIEALAKGKHKMAYLHHPDQGKLLEIFKHKLPLVVAAGGFVTNKKGKVLFIYRNDKWDLPKGKVDKKESGALPKQERGSIKSGGAAETRIGRKKRGELPQREPGQ